MHKHLSNTKGHKGLSKRESMKFRESLCWFYKKIFAFASEIKKNYNRIKITLLIAAQGISNNTPKFFKILMIY